MSQKKYNLEELQELKKQWYEEAKKSGIFEKVATVCCHFGTEAPGAYSKYDYKLKDDNVLIHVDHYGNFLTVHSDGKLVCSTHPTEKLFVAGEWEKKIEELYIVAKEKQDKKEALELEEKRRKLAQELGLE